MVFLKKISQHSHGEIKGYHENLVGDSWWITTVSYRYIVLPGFTVSLGMVTQFPRTPL